MKKKLLSILVFLFFIHSLQGQPPSWLWAYQAYGTGSEISYSVAADANGNSYITGYFGISGMAFGTDTLHGNSSINFFIAKVDAAGNIMWAKGASGISECRGNSVAVDMNGNSYVTGYFYNSSIGFDSITLTPIGGDDVFVVKYDSSGNVVWANKAGGIGYDRGTSIATDALGNSYVTGYFSNASISFGSVTLSNFGADDVFTVKYDVNGNVLWAKRAGSSDTDEGNAIAVDGSGNCFVTGYFLSNNLNFDTIAISNSGVGDLFIVKYDSSGNALWAHNAIGSADDHSTSIASDIYGNCFVSGRFFSANLLFSNLTLVNKGNSDIFLVKYDSSGNVVFANNFGGFLNEVGTGVATDAIGNCYLTGQYEANNLTLGTTILTNFNSGYNDGFVAKFDMTGNIVWAKNVGGYNDDLINGISVNGNGNCYITGGFYSSSLGFDSDTLFNFGIVNVFVAAMYGTPVGLTNELSTDVVVYPNPASDRLNICNREFTISGIELYDIFGKAVLKRTVPSGETNSIDLRGIPKGLYMLRLISEKNVCIKKIAIQ